MSLCALFAIIAAADVVLPGRLLFPDEGRFAAEAVHLAETGEFATGDDRAWEMPLTAMLYAPFFKLLPHAAAIRASRVMQALLHVLTAAGGASIAWRLFHSRATSLVALYSLIIYPSTLAYQAMLLSETPFIFFLVWGFALLYLWDDTDAGRRYFVPAAVVLSLSLYVKGTITYLVPVLVAVRPNRRGARSVLAACAIFAAVMSPWWVRNWSIFGEFVPLTTSASSNLYLGNNRANPHAGIDWSADVDQAEVASIRAAGGELEIDRAFGRAAKAFIMEDKAAFVHRMWLKFKRFWNFQSNYTGGGYGWLFSAYNLALLLSWGIACPLGLVSAWLNRRKWRDLLPIFLLVLYFTLIHCAVIASLRYRLPIEPFFIIVGADCVGRVARISYRA